MDILNQAFAGLKLQDLSNADSVATLLDQFGLRWTVNKEQLQLPDGTPTPFFGIVREDTKTVFSACKKGYVPYQNSELAELLIRISEKSGYAIHKGGMFDDGAKVYVQLDTGNSIKGIGDNKDTVNGYLTGINAHDGSHSLRWGNSNITISCRNTFYAASKQTSNKVRHTANMHDRIDAYLQTIHGVVEEERTLFERFKVLADRPMTKDNVIKVVKAVTSVDLNTPEREANEKYSNYAIARTSELMESITSETKQKGQTLWGLFSGVTHYTTHKMPVPNRTNARLESKYTGTALEIDNKILELVW